MTDRITITINGRFMPTVTTTFSSLAEETIAKAATLSRLVGESGLSAVAITYRVADDLGTW